MVPVARGGFARCVLVLALAATVPGCTELARSWNWNLSDEQAILARGWVAADKHPAQPQYCYTTIGNVDCRPHLQPLEASRRSGYPHPGDPR